MTTSATYMADLNRVRVSFSSLHADADVARVERSIDGLNWATVRGGDAVTLSSGAGHLDDYEFVPGVLNTYRVTAIDTGPQTFMTSGAAVTGNNTSLNPACAGATLIGDLVVLLATIRNSGTGSPNTPAGWTVLVDMGNVKLFGRYATANGSVAQTVTFSGGVANADVTAQMTTFRNTSIVPTGTPATVTNTSQQNVPWPAATPGSAPSVLIGLGWKQDDWSSAPTTGAWTAEIGQVASTAGDDAAHVWWYQARTDKSQKQAGWWTVTGGAAAISKAALLFLPPRADVGVETTTITPTFTQLWIKNLQRPYMNTALSTPVGLLQIEEEARAGVIPVVGRSKPVAVTDRRLGWEFTIGAHIEDATEKDRLRAILASGDTVFLHVPPGNIRLDSMYATIGRTSFDDEASIWWMPVQEVAAPAGTVSGATSTWATVVATYATWADLIAAKPTWADVLDIVGDPSDIITG